jgi:hypothetical protein
MRVYNVLLASIILAGLIPALGQDRLPNPQHPDFQPHRDPPRYTLYRMRNMQPDSFPKTGAYYRFVFGDFDQEFRRNESIENITPRTQLHGAYLASLDDPMRFVKDLASRGFDITHAWHRPRGQCGGSRAIRHEVFIVRLEQPNDALPGLYRFVHIDRPTDVVCEIGYVLISISSRK